MSLENSKVINSLNEIYKELSEYNKYSHDALLTKFINDRLSESLNQYNIELEKNITFLSNQAGMKVLKAISKKHKQEDKAIIETYFEENEHE